MYDNLYHHGIIGQKWGVRRFQNYNGKYTAAGKKRYETNKEKYDAAKQDYKAAKESFKNGDGSESAVKNAKKKYNSAKRRLDESYKGLKQSYLADEGKKLYGKGKTIRGNASRISMITTGTAVAAIATNSFWKSNTSLVTKYGNIPFNTLAATTIAAGGTAVAGILSIKSARDNKRLRAYYSRSYKGYE